MKNEIAVRYKSPQPMRAVQFKGVENYYDCLRFLGREKADKTDPETQIRHVFHNGDTIRIDSGDWIVITDAGPNVYTDETFHQVFEEIPDAITG